MSRISLAQQLAELSEPAPIDLDPEDIHAGAYAEDHSAIDDSAAREHYLPVAPSAIRKRQETVSDPKYAGVRTTRRELQQAASLSDGENVENNSSDEAESMSDEEVGSSGEDEETASSSTQGKRPRRADSPPDSPDAAHAFPVEQDPGPPKDDDLASSLRRTREEDRAKGKAVSRQIAIWDALLDTRIQLQKVLNTSARLPSHAHLHSFTSQPSARDALDQMAAEAAALSEELFTLQESLLEHNEGIHAPPRKRQKTAPEQDPSSLLCELSEHASDLEASYHAYLVQTLTKWSAKVQAVAPSVLLGNRTSFNKEKGKAGVVSMVDEVLRSDGAKLLARTRTRRSRAQRLGDADEQSDGEGEDKEDVEVFDDMDFYQQLLRDVIKARGGNNAQTGEQEWVAQQRDRKAKRKSRIDTKASKGRKLRYEVHAKLQNFMVPVPVTHGEWHDEQIDGLFSSLLGAG